MLRRTCCALVLILAACEAYAMQFEKAQVLVSPIVGRPFEADLMRIGRPGGTADGPTDMGSDSDSCRHSSGPCEYDCYVVTCPHTFFTALAEEWDPRGHFTGELSPAFVAWVTSKDGFNTQLQTRRQELWERYLRRMRAEGKTATPREQWVIPQEDIPVESRYAYALLCYNRRGARDSMMGRIALCGAWAVRCKLNQQVALRELVGGVQEVNDRLAKRVGDLEVFKLEPIYNAYKSIFERDSLTPEGTFTAGMAYLGMALRMGNPAECGKILEKMMDQFKEEKVHETKRGMIRQRRNLLGEYTGFLTKAVQHFTLALAAEEFPRPQIPDKVFIVGECLRRAGDDKRAYDWYLALSRMDETQPKSRAEIRSRGRTPTAEAPLAMQLAWRAEDAMAAMKEAGLEHPDEYVGPDRPLLDAIQIESLGTLSYKGTWKPRKGGSPEESEAILKETGFMVLEYRNRLGDWPHELGELWMYGVVRDREHLNRFHCPVTGAPLAYVQQVVEVGKLPQRTVLVTTSEAVPGKEGPRFGAFLSDLSVVWLPERVGPGEQVPAGVAPPPPGAGKQAAEAPKGGGR